LKNKVISCLNIFFSFIEVWKNFKRGEAEELFSINMIYVLTLTLMVSLVLRILKRNTKILNEKDRS